MSAGRRAAGAFALAAVMLSAAAALAVVAVRSSAPPKSLQERVRDVASTLRCPVCQNLSVADSPSRLASQMRETIASELQAGKTPARIRAEFAASYGEWVLLAPPKRGLDLALWLAPLALLIGGLAFMVGAVRRWTAGSAPEAVAGNDRVGSALSEADRRLLDRAMATPPEDGE
jgi:cytochrome c-type biogenesis protein CcmH